MHGSATSAWTTVGTAMLTAFTSGRSWSIVATAAAAVLLGGGMGGFGVLVINGDEADLGHLRVDAGVEPAHAAAADDADGQGARGEGARRREWSLDAREWMKRLAARRESYHRRLTVSHLRAAYLAAYRLREG